MANEIELLVSIRKQGEVSLKRRGDVITCRLAGGKWGARETMSHQVVLWPGEQATEEELRASQLLNLILTKKKSWGEPNPRVDFPFYEVVDEKIQEDNGDFKKDQSGNDIILRVMTNRSVLHFDFSELPESQMLAILDDTVAAEPLLADDLRINLDPRGIDKRDPLERGLKEHRAITEPDPILHEGECLRRDETTNIQDYISQDKKPIDSWST
tara:strand:+ start:1706 stop:2344 length:639 start_codon:yes stop_codon:yes gene_type:complete